MKLCICSNFVFPSVGGSENVIRAIAEGLILKYDYEVTVLGFNINKEIRHNGVSYKKCLKGDNLISQIAKYDHVFVYSDSLWEFSTLLHNIKSIVPRL